MIYVLLVDGEYWQLRDDGVLVKLSQEQYQNLEQVSTGDVVTVNAATSTDSTSSQRESATGTTIADFFARVSRDALARLPESGFETGQSRNLLENLDLRPLSDADLPPPIPADAEISISVDDNGDGFINTFEISVVDIFGETLNIYDRQPVIINLRDSDGLELEFATTINASLFSIPKADLSSLAQGELVVTATATDLYGNSITATDLSIIDTLAQINEDFSFNSGLVVNAAESASVDISGSTSEIEPGQQIRIVYSDINGLEIALETILDTNGNYSVAGVDLSSLADGPITETLSTIDIAGNPASQTTVITKDTQATITVAFDGALPYEVTDLADVTLSGVTSGVEAGQVVTVSVTDGLDSLQVDVVVSADQSWQTDALDFSTFNNGPLVADVAVFDLAGNPAADNTTTELYSIPADAMITIDVDDNGDGFINKFEVGVVEISGTTTNLSDNILLQIIVTDSLGVEVGFSTTSTDGLFELANQDFSGLAQGLLNVTVTATDFYDNTINASDSSVIDTLANITDDVSLTSGIVINAVESLSVDISGSTSEIEPGQQIFIVYSDVNGLEIAVDTTIDANGDYVVAGVDLSSLSDGEITETLSSIDIPGNTVSRTTLATKDTLATIDVVFDGNPPYSADEITAITVSGTTVGVEQSQLVNVNINDGVNSIDTTATVLADGSWQIVGEDLTGFNDGALNAVVSVSDLAGNPAMNSEQTIIDTMATIDIVTTTTIDIDALRRGDTVTIEGEVTEVEVGRPVSLRFYDSVGNEQIFITNVGFDGSWNSNVTITDLETFSSWNLQASVADNAGNVAIDVTPSLDVPTVVSLAEAALVANPSYTSDSTIRIVGYDALVLDTTQAGLEALQSAGVPLVVTVAGDGQSLTAMAGATLVLSVQLNGDDTASISLHAPVDQPAGSDSSISSIALLATQNDLDATSETLSVGIPIIIRESLEFTNDDAYSAVEQVLTSGNLFDNDVLLEGPLTIVQIQIAGITYSVSELSATTISNNDTKGSLTVASDGSWSFVADRNLDNTVLQQMSFTYSALDQDEDFDDSEVTITISDGVGGVIGNTTVPVVESDYDLSTAVDVNFIVAAGTDDLDPNSIRFSSDQVGLLDLLSYTSSGNDLTYVLANGGKTIIADVMGATVFEINLVATVDANGNLNAVASISEVLPVDHLATDDLRFPIVVEAEDNDGTISSSQSILLLKDGLAPSTSSEIGAVDESNLPAATFIGDLDIEIGSDEVIDIGFSLTLSDYPDVTSGGSSVSYQVSADGLLLTASTDTPVFTVELSAEPNLTSDSALQYTFTLLKALDQLDEAGLSASPLDLSFKYTVSDYDGNSATSFVNVLIADDAAASAIGTSENLQLSEPVKKLVNLGESTEGVVNFSLTASADPIVAARFDVTTGDVVLDKLNNTITQNGEALTWLNSGNNTVQILAANGSVVAELALPEIFSVDPGLNSDVPMSVTIFQPIDHIAAVTLDDNIILPLDVTFIDSDLTELTLTTEISVFDGLDPVAYSVQPLLVVEDDIALSNANDQALSFGREGSDKFVSVNLVLDTALKSGGLDVSLASSPDADGWWLASTSAIEVFKVRIDLIGNTDFELLSPLDHADAGGVNNLPINFSASMNDIDDDVSNIVTMTVNVTDDVPILSDRTIKLTEGVDKNINVLKNGEAGTDGGLITKISYDPGTGLVEYTFATNNPEVIDLVENGAVYGTVTAYQDGRLQIQTDVTLSSSFLDDFDYEVTDFDGDIQVSTVNLNVKDEQADIQIEPLSTDEDTTVALTLVANPGDLDNGEIITSISFNLAGLQGGTLTLNGAALAVDGADNPILSGSELLISNALTGEVVPNGVLEFTPALNSSDPTQQVTFDVVVTVDTNSGERTHDDSFEFSVTPIVDAPVWDAAAGFTYDLQEDDGGTSTNIIANLFDLDGSESLSYRIEAIEVGLVLASGGIAVTNGQVLTTAQMSDLTITSDENLAGKFTFNAIAIAKENSTGDTQELLQQITVNIAPVADTPSLFTLNVNMLEDGRVALASFINGTLEDIDGSESLEYELVVPIGWKIVDGADNEVGLQSQGVYRITDIAVQSNTVFLAPLEDLSSIAGNFTVDVTAISVESSVDGIAPGLEESRSVTRTTSVDIEGVVDTPSVGAGPNGIWSFDGTNITAQVLEDELIPLNFITGTQDDDGSEVFDFVLRDLAADVAIVDVNGVAVNLPVLGVFNGLPMYAVSSAQLASLSLLPASDFSGRLTFELLQTNTEPDGDSDTFNLVVDVTINPVVDTDDGINASSIGGEDTEILLNIDPILDDVDGSEVLTNVTLLSLPAGVRLFLDFVEIQVPVTGLDLNQLAINDGVTFDAFISGGRLRVRAPEDSDNDFSIPVEFEITDTSGLLDSTLKVVSGSLVVDVKASVDDSSADGITRIDTTMTTLVSTDGSNISLTGTAGFTEEDVDGSEYLDYISINVANAGVIIPSGIFISHPNGAINDGNGNWLIPAQGLTSSSLVDTISQLLDGATIASELAGTFEVVVSARVLDGNDDADIISNVINVEFVIGGAMGTASAVSILQASVADGLEEQATTLGEHFNLAPAGDANDIVSYRVDTADMPHGGFLVGTDVIAEYAIDGSTIRAFVFTNASLPSLTLTGIDEDFAGFFDLIVNKVSTDPLGDTLVTQENLSIEIAPVVDGVSDFVTSQQLEDIPLPLQYDLNSLLDDSSTDASEGLEEVVSVKFLAMSDASLSDPLGLLTDNGDGTFTLSDLSQLDQISLIPPRNQDGEFSIDVELTVEDRTSDVFSLGLTNPAISIVAKTVVFDVLAVTDPATVFAINQSGREDTDIDFSGLFVFDLDNDGSESLTMQLLGVPEGAILLWDSGAGLQQLVNSGGDSVNGYTWTFEPDQISDLVLRPPADFAGDIELSLQSTSMELSTLEVVTVTDDFTVSVFPEADNAYFYQEPSNVESIEGNAIQVDVFASTQEVSNPNETIVLSVVVSKGLSDATALDGLFGIRAPDGTEAKFVSLGFNFVALLETNSSELENFEFIAGSHAHGSLAVQINVGSKDSATVRGILESDVSDVGDFQSRDITIDISPEPDPPILTLTGSNIVSGEAVVPLGLSLQTINPATVEGETAEILITGLPEGVLLSGGAVQSGVTWIVAADDVETLAIVNADIVPPFSITIEAQSTLNGVTVVGGKQSLAISVGNTAVEDDLLVADLELSNLIIGGAGSDTLTGGNAEDTYLFRSQDLGDDLNPAFDIITNFSVDSDHIDLSDIDLASVVLNDDNPANTVIEIYDGADLVQSIELQGVTIDQLDGELPALASDAQILNQMQQDQVLLTG